MITVGIIGCGFIESALKVWLAKLIEGTPLGRLIAPLHELNVRFRGCDN